MNRDQKLAFSLLAFGLEVRPASRSPSFAACNVCIVFCCFLIFVAVSVAPFIRLRAKILDIFDDFETFGN